MDKNLIFAALIGAGIVFCIGLLVFFAFGRKKENKKGNTESFNENRVEEIFKEAETSKEPEKKEIKIIGDKYKVLGKEDEYIISFKGDRINFLVKDDEIIGFIDKEKSNKVYYY